MRETIVLRGAAQGTTYHIKFVAPANGVDAQRLQADVEKVLAEIDRQMSTYRADSEISRFNRAPAGEWFAVSAAVARGGRGIAGDQREDGRRAGCDGRAAGAAVAFRADEDGAGEQVKAEAFKPPSDEQLQAARKRVGYKKLDVRMKPPALRKKIEGLEVDLSSIASGYTIDRLAELLLDRGIKNFMVELGGEVRAAREARGWHAVANCDRAADRGEARDGGGGAARECGDGDGRRQSTSFSSTTANATRTSSIRRPGGRWSMRWRRSRWRPTRASRPTAGTRRCWCWDRSAA